jgi:peptidoglycan-N-acetylglucosamine deacetylase
MRVALTFDTEFPGRPARAGAEDRILETLASAEIRATFFLQGRWTRANPDVVARIRSRSPDRQPLELPRADGRPLRRVAQARDVLRAEQTIQQITGIDPKPWFRCPFGSGMDDSRVLGALEELGYRHVGWDVDPEDWDEDRTVDELVERAAGEGIVLLHAWPAVTADGLMHLIDAFRQREAEFVGVDELD